jgi:hypothetical protein
MRLLRPNLGYQQGVTPRNAQSSAGSRADASAG